MSEWKRAAAIMLASAFTVAEPAWYSPNDRKATKPKSKNRDKVKAARKQRNRK